MGPLIPFFELPLYPVAAVLGALVGSFLNVVIARLPAGESIVHPGSRCPACQTPIRWYQNIPIFSWLALRGRCASCRSPIALRYPMVELLTAVVFWAVAVRFGPSWGTLVGWFFVGGLIVVTFVDLDIWEIPDEISLPGIVLGCLFRPLVFDVPWWSGLAGAAVGVALLGGIRWFYLVFRDVEGMGLGDVKLIGMIGAFVGIGGILPVILVASISGTIIGGLLLAFSPRAPAAEPEPVPSAPPEGTGEATPDEAETSDDEAWEPPANAVPFGPFLSLGGIAEVLLGPRIDVFLARFGL